jgi:predicted molibdopterin-dependent oxidoreductase YjgC
MIKLKIDGNIISVPDDTSVLDAARKYDISIPTLCHHPKLTAYGGCRLCLVEIKGMNRPVTACTTPVSEGMDVSTKTPQIEKLRRTVLELLLSDHPNDCMVCEMAGDCTLQELAYFYGLRENRFIGERRTYTQRDGNPLIERDMEKCILCNKCVRVCDEIQGVRAIEIAYRGFQAKVCPPYERDLECEFCGQCIRVCPTGALTGKISKNEIVRVTSKEESLNEGWLCPKGTFGYHFVNNPARLTTPLIKQRGKFREATWEEALDHVAKKLSTIKEKYGADSIGALASARCTNEENYLFQKLVRAAIGTHNIDHCARL